MGYKLNGCDTEGFPFYLVKDILKFVHVPYFIETGTAGGQTIMEASKHFHKCWTIELIEGRSAKGGPDNVVWLTGHSARWLPAIIEEIEPTKYYAMFFLDAHYSDPGPNTTGFAECPLMEELKVIATMADQSIIVIDDARLFMGHPPDPLDPREWPRIQDIFVFMKEKFPNHITTITDDYIYAFPEVVGDPVNAEWRGRFNIRYPSPADKLKTQVKDVFKALVNYADL